MQNTTTAVPRGMFTERAVKRGGGGRRGATTAQLEKNNALIGKTENSQ